MRAGRRVTGERSRALAIALVLFVPCLSGAQQPDSTRMTIVRAVTPFEIEVERLARTLVSYRQRSLRLAGTKEQLQVSLRSGDLPDGERGALITQLRFVDAQLASLEATRLGLRRELEQLCAPSRQTEGWMGITFQSNFVVDMTREGVQLTRFNGHPAIESVEPNSPAEKAGVRRGDVLLSLAGRDLEDAAVVFQELLKPGARLSLRLRRGLETKMLSMTVEPRPADFQPTCAWEDDLIASALSPVPGGLRVKVLPLPPGTAIGRVNGFQFETRGDGRRVIVRSPDEGNQPLFVFSSPGSADWAAGAQLAVLNGDLAKLAGVDRGVFVVDVARRSPAAQSGLRGGDVIVSAEGRALTGPGVLRQLMMDRAESKELTLQVVRLKKSETIVLKW
ncbi:MAG: PDZ domain-containing protein [Gemmatimonadaceae bacterium]